MSCKNMYFEICLTEMNYFAVRFLSRNLFPFQSACLLSALQREPERNREEDSEAHNISCPFPFTHDGRATKLPFTLFYAEILPFFSVSKLTLSYRLERCGLECLHAAI